MADLKHVGRLKSSGRKCLVVFRTLPNDAFNCLVVLTENLHSSYHDALISLVESNAAQSAFEFADVLNRSVFSDGTQMLQSLHLQGLLTKVATDQIEMIPNAHSSIVLSDLNQLIAESKGVSVQDLAIKNDVKEVANAKDISPATNNTDPKVDQQEDFSRTTSASVNSEATQPVNPTITAPLTDADLAKKYRSDADRLAKEAANLRRMAEDLVPTKKKKAATISEGTISAS